MKKKASSGSDKQSSTVEVDKETRLVISQYCILKGIKVKDFIKDLTDDKLEPFKDKIEEMKKIII